MKVLIPFYRNNPDITIDGSIIVGGLERFIQLVTKYADINVIPLYFSKEDKEKRLVTKKCIDIIVNEKPDIIFCNYDSSTLTTKIQEIFNIPILWVTHTNSGGIFKLNQLSIMEKFIANGGTLAMVSQSQYNMMNRLSERVKKKSIHINGGIIEPSFVQTNTIISSNIKWDCITIGRTEKEKDPFLLLRLNKKLEKNIAVITNNDEMTDKMIEYKEKNAKYFDFKGNNVLYNLPYKNVMEELSQSFCYLSTCSRETWGITALEAFSYGIPVILISNSSNNYRHASEDIAPGFGYETISKKDPDEFKRALDKISGFDRVMLSEKTKEKHSLEKWKAKIKNLLDLSVENHKKVIQNKRTFYV